MNSSPFGTVACVCITALMFSLESDAAGAEVCPLAAQVAPTRFLWHAGEPIEVKVRLSTGLNHGAVVPLTYPSLSGGGASGISFSLSEDIALKTPSGNTIETLVNVDPQSSWEVNVYANKFIPILSPGEHRVYWRLELGCLNSEKKPLIFYAQSSWFHIFIDAKPSPNLAQVANSYLERFDSLNSSSRWSRREAIEALSNMSDPAVLPTLEKLSSYGYQSAVLRALGKFDGNLSAARIIATILSSANSHDAREALQVARNWHTDLMPELVGELLGSSNEPMKLILIDYLGSRRSVTYDRLLKNLLNSPNGALAKAAQAALSR